MYRTNDILQWLISLISILVVFYLIILFLPFILVVVGGYFLYAWIKIWMVNRKLKEYFQQTNENEENKVIDAEFEILDEKKDK